MKSTIVLSAAFFLLTPALVSAQTVTPSSFPSPREWRKEIREDRRDMFKNIGEAVKEARENAREAREKALQIRQTNPPSRPTGTVTPGAKRAKFQQRLTQTYDRLLAQIEARYNQLLASKTKIQARITEAKSAGINTTEAQAKLDTFTTAKYQASLSAFKFEYSKLLASTSPGLELGTLRSAGAKVAQDLNDMRKILADTLRLLIKANK
jgi:hypothetical protein